MDYKSFAIGLDFETNYLLNTPTLRMSNYFIRIFSTFQFHEEHFFNSFSMLFDNTKLVSILFQFRKYSYTILIGYNPCNSIGNN